MHRNPSATNCSTCRQLSLEGQREQTFLVAPAAGGGWHSWAASFLRLVCRIGHQPTQALIVCQPLPNYRYVQMLIGHGVAYAEVGSNNYLMGDDRLSTEQEELLILLGWQAPHSETDPFDEDRSNWQLPLIHGDWSYLVDMFMSTMVGILGFIEHLPVEIRTFVADSPCRECSWPDAFAHFGALCAQN